ncbi:MAG: DNA ligase [Thiotrichaceae bacterium]
MTTLKHFLSAVLLWALFPLSATFSASPPELLLAKKYDKEKDIEISRYFISEKYDGVRALWNGKQLVSRQGNVYHAPNWFIADFPNQSLDGELWISRGHFEDLVSTVKKAQPIDTEWTKVRYMVFELPKGKGTFGHRLEQLAAILAHNKSKYIKLIEQFRLHSHQELMDTLKEITQHGAEGLMMHRADALYHTGRSDDLLKVKIYQNTEATVIQHIPGRGKYTGMLGSVLVQDKAGKRFKIGSGFSDAERANPPPVGSLITYKYYGLTKNKIPRFASFIRIRK